MHYLKPSNYASKKCLQLHLAYIAPAIDKAESISSSHDIILDCNRTSGILSKWQTKNPNLFGYYGLDFINFRSNIVSAVELWLAYKHRFNFSRKKQRKYSNDELEGKFWRFISFTCIFQKKINKWSHQPRITPNKTFL